MPDRTRKHRRATRDLFLGVDGGGTKTHSVILSAEGELLAEDLSGPSNPFRTGLKNSADTIALSAARACDKIGRTTGSIVSAVTGLAGVRREDLRSEMRRLLSRELTHATLSVVTDAEIALYAVLEKRSGLVVIAGTGSIVYGRNSRGRTALAGGWGPIAGDEGGGVSIAIDALSAVARASDGRGPKTELSKLAAEYFRSKSADDLVVAIYSPHVNFTRIAGFATSVARAAARGDKTAVDILSKAGTELGDAACAVVRELGMTRSAVEVGTVGGVFRSGEIVKRALEDQLSKCVRSMSFTDALFSPAEAAARMAYEQAFAKITEKRKK
ncbi:MAG: hypothetical protein DWQ47_01775 [Acidobacteria bacterium]|nr:MAG: hypothetical protein DWQ32_05325 [Acidobacteriota bacterium]REK01153.1 MAG: hypothetical protein DWQ38_01760 [Acidobacteriota bacterium]REK14109.1 MAG: hypothetical protein DWQ43_11015 [Acidobacteriota bacterium]REK44824.1 MAG: hypothetical protein DWQ47_01775 [Acidobacteriota bacterium]